MSDDPVTTLRTRLLETITEPDSRIEDLLTGPHCTYKGDEARSDCVDEITMLGIMEGTGPNTKDYAHILSCRRCYECMSLLVMDMNLND